MIRRVITIDEDKCNGCGLCANACHEHAIAIVNNKAKLIKDDYCDGLGDCLPTCPTGAITFEEREAAPYNELAVKARQSQWPIQIKLTPVVSPSFDYAHLLIAADCTAFAYKDFHGELAARKALLIGCPKLDAIDYSEKLAQIIASNEIREITVVRMNVPCCGGMEYAVKEAMRQSGKHLTVHTITISTTGDFLNKASEDF